MSVGAFSPATNEPSTVLLAQEVMRCHAPQHNLRLGQDTRGSGDTQSKPWGLGQQGEWMPPPVGLSVILESHVSARESWGRLHNRPSYGESSSCLQGP